MRKDQEKWDAKYLENPGDSDPSKILKKYWNLSALGNALDIACGNGRNSIFLADKGFAVDAVDISTVATHGLAERNRNINVICKDLDTWNIPKNRYEMIVNTRFLDRRLFPMIKSGLKPLGVLIFESFIGGQNDKYCLKENELLQVFHSFRIIYYEEKKENNSHRFDQTVSLVAVKKKTSAFEYSHH